MDKELLRPVQYSFSNPRDRGNKNGYFHKWVTKVYPDTPKDEVLLALVEEQDGTMVFVDATDIKFLDR